MLKIRLTLLRGAALHFLYENLIWFDMFLFKAEIYLWFYAKNKTRLHNAKVSWNARSEKMIATLDANLKSLKDAKSQLEAILKQVEMGKNND